MQCSRTLSCVKSTKGSTLDAGPHLACTLQPPFDMRPSCFSKCIFWIRVSLLRAAAFHGSSHQFRPIEIGRHRIQFVYQAARSFATSKRQEWLVQLKNETGFVKVAGVELTLFDVARYFHKAAGINGAAQVVHDLGGKADARRLSAIARVYENSAVRRLGYLLDHFGHERQAGALLQFAQKAKSMKALDPSVRVLVEGGDDHYERNLKWMLIINEVVEIDL